MEKNTWMESQDQAKIGAALTKLESMNWTMGGRNFLDMAGGSPRFALWLAMVDQRCSRRMGLGIFDLEDWHWADAYENGSSPSQAVRDMLEDHDLIFEG